MSQTQISILFFILGSCLGSFLNVCIYRIPRKISLIKPASHCPQCGNPIRPYDNIPILSFLILRGRCRSCGGRISFQYPVVEAWAGVLLLGLYLRFDFGADFLIHALLSLSLVVVFFIDHYHSIIPDVITIPGVGLAIALSFIPGGISPISCLLGIGLGGGGLLAVALLGRVAFKKEAMGGGDLKLAAMIGGFLGWRVLLVALFLSSLLGAVVGVLLIVLRVRSRSSPIPFGPFIALGSIASQFWGKDIIRAYLGLFW